MSADSAKQPLLAAEAGMAHAAEAPADSIQAWLELMTVVEALCPTWPDPAHTLVGDFRL